MNKDQVKGRVEEVKGKVKEVAGNIVGNKSLEGEGLVQKTVGKIQAGVGDAKAELKSKL
ncbi:CsbD family protein [Polynucleobacter sp. UK-Gri1-W3]|uniref:CsbD family protein n=1 Tax=Polynucleobacter sp. UK-Gri1-W3 TaxID=1819737 RepID=UPI001C0D3EE5|nr:CsbD family protein [Polynucleobacter sp. UK-Gri1-W3]MBU3538947.1 CsbD family protein [Polynucleobacter sp. UK-Gri1-W3]